MTKSYHAIGLLHNIEIADRGRIRQRARLTTGIDPRVIAAEHGWWFPEDPAPGYGVWRSNVNLLTDNQPPYDPAMGTYQLRALLCRVARAEPEIAGIGTNPQIE